MTIVLLALAVIALLFAFANFHAALQLRRMARHWNNAQWHYEARGYTLMGMFMVGLAITSLALLSMAVRASTLTEPASPAAAAKIHVPDASARYRHYVAQAASEVWGIDAPVARLAAQIHQESAWDAHATSDAGAEGLAQFMPATGRWLAKQFPELGHYDPWDPRWSARAAAVYDQYLVARNDGDGACATWAFALSAYNGGERALHAEQADAQHAGRSGARWFGNVARYRARSVAAWRQNRSYVRRILTVLEPAYIRAGWSGEAVCQ